MNIVVYKMNFYQKTWLIYAWNKINSVCKCECWCQWLVNFVILLFLFSILLCYKPWSWQGGKTVDSIFIKLVIIYMSSGWWPSFRCTIDFARFFLFFLGCIGWMSCLWVSVLISLIWSQHQCSLFYFSTMKLGVDSVLSTNINASNELCRWELEYCLS